MNLGLGSGGRLFAGSLHERLRGVGRLGAELDPMVDALDVDHHCSKGSAPLCAKALKGAMAAIATGVRAV